MLGFAREAIPLSEKPFLFYVLSKVVAGLKSRILQNSGIFEKINTFLKK